MWTLFQQTLFQQTFKKKKKKNFITGLVVVMWIEMELLVDSVSVMIDGDSFWLEVVWTFVPRLYTGIPMEYLDTENTML